MKHVIAALAGTLALTGVAFAAESNRTSPGASSNTPGHEMQDKGSMKGSPGASGYAPGHEMKSDSTGTTRSGSGSAGTSSGTKSGGSTAR